MFFLLPGQLQAGCAALVFFDLDTDGLLRSVALEAALALWVAPLLCLRPLLTRKHKVTISPSIHLQKPNTHFITFYTIRITSLFISITK